MLDLADLEAALSSFRSAIGMGLDGQNPKNWSQLPPAGRRQLLDVLHQVEDAMIWPGQVRDNVVQLLRKSPTADRPITLAQGLYRCWSVARRRTVAFWVAGESGA
eukprot:81007-Pyramimonas_sp.AAC.1